jgi:hypothetical protein
MRIAVRSSRGTTIASSRRMLRDLGLLAVLAWLVAGCASLSFSAPPMTPQAACERNHHSWRPLLNFCEPC